MIGARMDDFDWLWSSCHDDFSDMSPPSTSLGRVYWLLAMSMDFLCLQVGEAHGHRAVPVGSAWTSRGFGVERWPPPLDGIIGVVPVAVHLADWPPIRRTAFSPLWCLALSAGMVMALVARVHGDRRKFGILLFAEALLLCCVTFCDPVCRDVCVSLGTDVPLFWLG